MSRILVVDEEGEASRALEGLLGDSGYEVAAVPSGELALDRLQREPFDLVILDLSMPGIDGLEALREIKRHQPKLPVIIVTGQGTMETAIEAGRRGAYDYQLKPLDPEEILRIVERALKGAEMMKGRVVVGPKHVGCHADAIVGRCRAMQEVFKAIGLVASTDVTVLICGESGTGKELIARAIHQHSLRDGKPLLIVNCAAIPEALLEGELFGFERGAFTGAVGRRIGKFEQADGGTIFLDEIGDAPLSIQAKILRVLQEKTFERLGGNETLRADVRMLAATNRDLERGIREGSFRADLYHRLNVVSLQVPPLRERREDIPLLVDHFLARIAEELNVERPMLADDASKLLQEYSWPGNVRELQHRIRRAVLFTRGYPIQASDFPFQGDAARPEPRPPRARTGEEGTDRLVQEYLDRYTGPRAHEELVERIEKALLQEGLRRAHGNQTHAARLLGLARATFVTKLQKYRLHQDAHGLM